MLYNTAHLWHNITEVAYVAQAMVNFRMDEDIKKGMEQACKDMGMSITTAFTIFATRVSKERRIPFEVVADPNPFYSEANMARLREAIADAKAGRNMTAHELIEVDDE
ncbi:MAG: type II toxin-antitoxin system RelB/DinJ family antitoxin [Leptospirales bacterium]|nr:type II toxin-antitoxin system RelB/DinJ family antitoxin [Leptospirales bacterium]